jgi:hypothetical protein
VVGVYASLFGNNVQFTIDVGWGEVNDNGTSTPLAKGDLGESHWYFNSFNYSTAVATIENSSSFIANSVTLPATSPETNSNLVLTDAQQLALGFGDPTAKDGSVGSVGFNASTSWSFGPGAPSQSSEYYFIGVAEHEISEVMGRISALDLPTTNPNDYSLMDLLRYSSPGNVQTSASGNPSYFSINRGGTDLADFNNFSENNGDLGDWAATVKDDAFLDKSSSGVINALSPTDILLMDALGWDVSSITIDQWNGGSGLWSDTSEWDLGGPPGRSDLAALDAAGSYTVASNQNVTVNSLLVAAGVNLNITGGTFTVTDANPDSDASTNDGNLALLPSFNDPHVALTIGGTFVNSGAITLNVPARSPILVDAAILPAEQIGGPTETATINISGDVTLEGLGNLDLTDSPFNSIAGNAPGAALDDINNDISGAGTIGNSNMSLTVGARATIDADDPVALVINATQTANSGLMEATGSGGLFISDAVDNLGTIKADGGNVTVGGVLSGAGQVQIFGGDMATLKSSASNEVIFGAGGNSSLVLQNAQSFAGTVAGLAQSDNVDLENFLFSGNPTISKITGTGAAGTDTDVTIKDETLSVVLKLANATAGEFAVNASAYSLSTDGGANAGTLFHLASPHTG